MFERQLLLSLISLKNMISCPKSNFKTVIEIPATLGSMGGNNATYYKF